MMKKTVSTTQAPAAIGPYSQAVCHGGLLYTSGQLGLDPGTGELAEGVEAQTRQALCNLGHVLEAAGSGFGQVLKTTVFLAHLADFAAVNRIYAEFFTEPYPARSCVAVAQLPRDALVEIETVAAAGE